MILFKYFYTENNERGGLVYRKQLSLREKKIYSQQKHVCDCRNGINLFFSEADCRTQQGTGGFHRQQANWRKG